MKNEKTMKTEFETFRKIGAYEISSLTQKQPSAINFLSYKKFKVTVEEIEESNDVYIKRLEELLLAERDYSKKEMIKSEIRNLKEETK